MNKEIAQTIIAQLGGNRFITMTGTKNFVFSKQNLTMRLTKNKISAKWLRISLINDSYKMEFISEKKVLKKELFENTGVKIYDSTIITKKEIDGVYCDQLQQIFTEVTGLYTSF